MDGLDITKLAQHPLWQILGNTRLVSCIWAIQSKDWLTQTPFIFLTYTSPSSISYPNRSTIISTTLGLERGPLCSRSRPSIGICIRHDTPANVTLISAIKRRKLDVFLCHLSTKSDNKLWSRIW